MFVPSFIPRAMFTMDALLLSLVSAMNEVASNSGCFSSFRVLTHIIEKYLVHHLAELSIAQREQFPWIAVCSNIFFTPSIFNEIEPFFPHVDDVRTALSSNPAATRFIRNRPAWVAVSGLVMNKSPLAMRLLSSRLHEMNERDWFYLSTNPMATDILRDHFYMVFWGELVKEERLFCFFKTKYRQVMQIMPFMEVIRIELIWETLSPQPWAARWLIEECPQHIVLSAFCGNTCTDCDAASDTIVSAYLRQHVEKLTRLNWFIISANPSAMSLLLDYPKNVNPMQFVDNMHPHTVHVLRDVHPEWISGITRQAMLSSRHPDMHMLLMETTSDPNAIDWEIVNSNPVMIPILLRFPEHIKLEIIMMNHPLIAREILHVLSYEWFDGALTNNNVISVGYEMAARCLPAEFHWIFMHIDTRASCVGLNVFREELLKRVYVHVHHVLPPPVQMAVPNFKRRRILVIDLS